MKKYLFIAFVALSSLTISCTTDKDFPTSNSNTKVQEFDNALMQKDGDSIGEGDTGGQGGSTPIKPPKP